MIMGFIIHFYITFGTNVLTAGPAHIAVFLPISVFWRKGISHGVQTEWNLRDRSFWNKRDPEDLECKSRKKQGGHVVGGHAQGAGAPPPSWAPCSSTDVLLPPIYTHIPWKHPGAPQTPIPPPQPSVPVRSHLRACSGAPPKGASITEGFYINTIASPMSCE